MDYKLFVWGKRFFTIHLFLFTMSFTLFGQSEVEKIALKQHTELNNLKQLIDKFEKQQLSFETTVLQKSKQLAWPHLEKQLNGTVVALNEIGTDGTPLFYTTYLSSSSTVTRSNALYKEGALGLNITGSGMEVGIWDAGVALATHQEFNGRVVHSDNAHDIDFHGTMVTGAMVAKGVQADAKGIAFEATALTHDWSRDKIEAAEAAANGLLISNHSYGIKSDRVPDWYFGSYIKVSQDWDNIMYYAPHYLMVTAAGNAQRSNDNASPSYGKPQDGFDLLTGFSTSKNGLVVAAADTQIRKNGILRSATVSSYSSFGPTDDGRIKPDIAGDGNLIYSTAADGNTSYQSAKGTSMAAPGVSASLLLLQQYHNELYDGYMRSATLKGLALHTSDDVNAPGPDYKMGWGVINTERAAQVLQQKDYSTLIDEVRLTQDDILTYDIRANGNEPLQVSISWTDQATATINRSQLNALTPALVNDLDIRVLKDGKTYYPWKLSVANADQPAKQGDNLVDPFERVDIEDAKGTYRVIISHKGNLTNELQDVSVIISGAQLTSCSLQIPENPEIKQADTTSVTLNLGDTIETLYELAYREEDNEDWLVSFVSNGEFTLNDLVLGQTYRLRLRAVCTQTMVSDYTEELQFVFEGKDTFIKAYEPFSTNEALAIKVYPNPVVDAVQIASQIGENAFYTVVSTSGTILKRGSIGNGIAVADLSTGLYIVTVQDGNGIRSAKFYKN